MASTAKEVKELLLILNLKAEKLNTNYCLVYQYQYMQQYKRISCRTKIIKFISNKVNNTIYVKSDAGAMQYINSELKQFN